MPKVTKMQDVQVGPITSAVLSAFFSGTDAAQASEKIAAVEMPRMKYLFGFFPQSELNDVQTAIKELRADAKNTHGAEAPEYKTAKVRAAEIAVLYGAYTFAGLEEPSKGYHATVKQAREVLKEANLRANGQPIPEAWEKEIDREAGITAAEQKAVEKARRHAEQRGETLSPEQAVGVKQATRDAVERASAVKLAATLYKAQVRKQIASGKDQITAHQNALTWCEWLIEALEGAIAIGAGGQEEIAEQQKAA